MGLLKRGDGGAVDTEIGRLSALSLRELAAEILAQVPSYEPKVGVYGPTEFELARMLSPSKPSAEQSLRLAPIIAEGLQVLEHAGLVRLRQRSTEGIEYPLTRAGEAALADGNVTGRLRDVAG